MDAIIWNIFFVIGWVFIGVNAHLLSKKKWTGVGGWIAISASFGLVVLSSAMVAANLLVSKIGS